VRNLYGQGERRRGLDKEEKFTKVKILPSKLCGAKEVTEKCGRTKNLVKEKGRIGIQKPVREFSEATTGLGEGKRATDGKGKGGGRRTLSLARTLGRGKCAEGRRPP